MTTLVTPPATPPVAPLSVLSANMLCTASMLIWAAGLPAADVLIPLVEPLPLSAARIALAALVLLPVWALIEGLAPLRAARWLRGIAVGGGTIGFGAFMLVVGQGMTDAVTVAVISATMPVIGLSLEVILDGRKITLGLVLGVALSLAGGMMTLLGKFDQLGIGLGAALCFGSVFLFTIGSRWTVTAFPALTPLGRTTVTLTGAAIASVVAATLWALAGGLLPDLSTFGLREAGALLLFSVGGLAISQVLWIVAVGRLGIGLSSLHINLTPFYVMLIFFALGAAWDWREAAGAAIVGLGVLIAQGVIPLGRRAG